MDTHTIHRRTPSARRVAAFMVAALIILAPVFILTACSPRIVTVAVHDTTTFTRIETVRDTVISAPLPVESALISTPDTTSTLETSLAVSTATITAGHLHHSIENKRTALQVPAKIPQEKEIIREVKEVPVPVEVPKPYIPKWTWYVLAWAVLSTLLLAAFLWLRLRV